MKRVSDADLKLLRVFLTVVECKGFAAAQAELNLSAPSISGYISALERRLGMRLCSRGRSGFALTDKGAVIHREARRLLGATEEFVTQASAAKGRPSGTLKLGLADCTVTDPNAPMVRAIERFNRRDHDVRIEIQVAPPASLQRSVLDHQLHLAIAGFPAEISILPGEWLYDERNSFYCGRAHPLHGRVDVTMTEIRKSRVIARSYWRHADLARLGVEREAAMVDIMEAQAMLILSGGYLGYLPEHYAAPWVQSGQMSVLLPGELSYVSPFSLIARRASSQIQVVRQFIADLRASLPGTSDGAGRTAPTRARRKAFAGRSSANG